MGITRQGKRIKRREVLKESKWHKKEFYKIIEELDYVSSLLHLEGVELTEDNIEEEVSKVSEVKLGAMEKMVLLNKQRKRDGGDQSE